MIGDGCCAFVSISLGQNEVPKAKRSVGNAVMMCLVSSIVLAALYLIFADTILAMFGGTVKMKMGSRMMFSAAPEGWTPWQTEDCRRHG